MGVIAVALDSSHLSRVPVFVVFFVRWYVAASTSTSGMGWVGNDRHPTTATPTVSSDCRKRDRGRDREGETDRQRERDI